MHININRGQPRQKPAPPENGRVFGRKYQLYIRQPTPEEENTLDAPTGREAVDSGQDRDVSIDTTNELLEMDLESMTDEEVGVKSLPDSKTVLITPPMQITCEAVYEISSRTSAINLIKLRVFNLSDKTINLIEKDGLVLMRAGYAQDARLPVLFMGTILKVETYLYFGERVTSIVCQEAASQQRRRTINKTYPKGITYRDIIADLLEEYKAVGIPTNLAFYNHLIIPIDHEYQLIGTLKEALNDVIDALPYDEHLIWYISAGKINILPFSITNVHLDFVDVTPRHIIGAAEKISEVTSDDLEEDDAIAVGRKVTVFLNAKIRLEHLVRIEESNGDIGIYRPVKVTHNLDYYGNDWSTTIETDGMAEYANLYQPDVGADGSYIGS